MRRFGDPAARKLVAETERFLAGRYADDLTAVGLPVPVWAWTNLLAHGTLDELREIAPRGDRVGVVPDEWPRARSFLASEILGLVDGGVRLDRLQRMVLVPLELELSSQAMVAWWRPGRWIATVLAALPGGSRRQPHVG
ncbi:MAG TPA: hypothetical protein VFO65_08575 [Acidimicrobiales bacterium]|nr:hypothetical protein [Acidimicrobiales bacterium]